MPKKEIIREVIVMNPELVNKVIEAQQKTGIVSRSEMYRQLIRAGLEKLMAV